MAYVLAAANVEVVALILGSIITMGTLYKTVPPAWQFVKAAAKIPLFMEAVYAEFRPNGGGSMQDKITSIDEKCTKFSKELAELTIEESETSKELKGEIATLKNDVERFMLKAEIRLARLEADVEKLDK